MTSLTNCFLSSADRYRRIESEDRKNACLYVRLHNLQPFVQCECVIGAAARSKGRSGENSYQCGGQRGGQITSTHADGRTDSLTAPKHHPRSSSAFSNSSPPPPPRPPGCRRRAPPEPLKLPFQGPRSGTTPVSLAELIIATTADSCRLPCAHRDVCSRGYAVLCVYRIRLISIRFVISYQLSV